MTKTTTDTRRIPTDPRKYAAMIRMAERAAHQYEQERETQRRRETDLLAAAAILSDPSDHLLAVAEQIRDHRAAGNYTTIHR